jgi:hypothetical protein
MPDRVALLGHLAFVEMPFSIPLAREIILVFAPGNSRHEMCFVTFVTPCLNALLERQTAFFMMLFNAVNNSCISADIGYRFPGVGGLKSCLLS